MVPHSQHRGIQQSADMLRNRSKLLKLEKKILITIIFTIMCTMCQQQQCGCRQWCPQPRMDRLQQFWCNNSVLWIYCHRPVARFPRRRLGRQSKYGRCGGDLGGSTTIDLALSTCAFPPLAEFGNATTGVAPALELLLRGGRGGGSRGSGGIKKVSPLIARLGSQVFISLTRCVCLHTSNLTQKVWHNHHVNICVD